MGEVNPYTWLYLAWLEKYESVEGESPPIGLILCAGKNPDHIELLQLYHSNIRVADYLTALPPKEVLLNGFHRAIAFARNRLDESRQNPAEKTSNDHSDD